MRMLNIPRLVKKIFKSDNDRELDRLKSLVTRINRNEDAAKNFKDDQFPKKTMEFKQRFKKGESLESLLPETFALVREAAFRALNERHYDVQLMGGIVLHENKIAEMKTGEGKTLVSTLPVYLNSLEEKGVHIVTVNDYLAQRDSEWMGKIYHFLGLQVGCITNSLDDYNRKKNYNYDVTYGTNSEFGFDYLRDNMKLSISDIVQRGHNFCIVDEVDSVLIDEARTPLIISGATEDKTSRYLAIDKLIKQLNKTDFEIDEKDKNVMLTDKGTDSIEKIFSNAGILKNNNFYDPENMALVHHVNQALRANYLFAKDKDYMVKDNSVKIIDEHTGRILEGRRFSDGLHQSLEAKEHVEILSENETLASITYQNYFRMYRRLSGMTGTAATEAEEFFDIYNLPIVSIPTHKSMIRKDWNDQIFRTEQEKNIAIVNKILECHKERQPVLVGTTSVEKSEIYSSMLKKKNIKHSVLSAKHHEKEAQIIADAGKLNTVTIATSMAGRGQDIKLGGKQIDKNDNSTFEEKDKVKELGGLSVSAVSADLYGDGRDDLSLFYFKDRAKYAALYTKSNIVSESIHWNLKIKNKFVRALLVNTKNANTFTGRQGFQGLKKLSESLSKYLTLKLAQAPKGIRDAIDPNEIIFASTGVIGDVFPTEKIKERIPYLVQNLKDIQNKYVWFKAASSILTTDTRPKLAFEECEIGSKKIKISAIAKGSGMIAPKLNSNHATMLAFIFTDANIPSDVLKGLLSRNINTTFNAITVDGDTSTNDAVMIFATGKVKNSKIYNILDPKLKRFEKALHNVMLNLSKQIVIDGEGAKKFVTINVIKARSIQGAKKIAFSVANSPLVKTAVAGEDPNYGRIIMAIGKSKENITPNNLTIRLGKFTVVENGKQIDNYNEEIVKDYMRWNAIEINIELNMGKSNFTVYTCDFTKDYIDINTDYRN